MFFDKTGMKLEINNRNNRKIAQQLETKRTFQ